jgi:hypothetical protein
MSNRSGVFRIGFLAGLTFGYDCGSEAVPKVIREFVELRIPVYFDGLFGGIADDVAVVAPRKMIFQFGLGAVINDAVEIIR